MTIRNSWKSFLSFLVGPLLYGLGFVDFPLGTVCPAAKQEGSRIASWLSALGCSTVRLQDRMPRSPARKVTRIRHATTPDSMACRPAPHDTESGHDDVSEAWRLDPKRGAGRVLGRALPARNPALRKRCRQGRRHCCDGPCRTPSRYPARSPRRGVGLERDATGVPYPRTHTRRTHAGSGPQLP